MQSLDNWVSAGDICEAWPCDPGKNALKVGGKLPLPLHHGLQDSPTAAQQTQPLQKNNNTTDQQSMEKKWEWGGGKKCWKVWRRSNRDGEKKADNVYGKRTDLIWIVPHRPGNLVLLCRPPHEIIFILYESKGSPVENERLHKPEPEPSEWERRRSLLQGPCCYSKHLPLCGRPSRPIVVQKLVVLPLAPFGSRGMRQTPLLLWVQIRGWIDAWPRLPSPLAVALCPLSQSTVSFCFFFFSIQSVLFSSQEHFQANIPIVFSFFLLYSYSPFSFGVYAYCSLEHPHYTHGYILRASLFDFGLVGSEWWAGGSCRAGPALRAPQPASRRVGLGVLLGWALLQRHWCYC